MTYARRLRKEGKTDHEENARNELYRPSCTEGIRSGNKGATVSDEVHDQDTPFDGQLLNNDDGTALRVLRDFCEVHRYLRRCDTDSKAVQDASTDQHTAASGGCLDGCSDEPENTREEEAIAATHVV